MLPKFGALYIAVQNELYRMLSKIQWLFSDLGRGRRRDGLPRQRLADERAGEGRAEEAAGEELPEEAAGGGAIFGKISAKCCSFSAVSAPIFARKYAFCSIFQNLPDYQAEFFEICQIFTK